MTQRSMVARMLQHLFKPQGHDRRQRHSRARRSRFRNPARFGSAGLALPAAIFLVVVVVILSLVLMVRSLGTWLRSNGRSDTMAAKDAAEYGYIKLISQLNSDSKAYLLVTNFNNWNGANGASRVVQSDLDSCDIYVSTSPDSSTDPIAGVNTNTRLGKTVSLPDSPSQSYSLTNYTAPSFAPGKDNNGICSSSTSAAKFASLFGGSAVVEVTGSVTRNGNVAATYVLRRSVHVKFPNQAISNPIVLIGDGSTILGLNGRICQTSNITATSCTGLPLTTIACADLEDCIALNVDALKKKRNKYCTSIPPTPGKKYKKNIPCNEFQQLIGLPAFPVLGGIGYPDPVRPLAWTSADPYISIDYNCDKDIKKCDIKGYSYKSAAEPTKLEPKDIKDKDFSSFPYESSVNTDTLSRSNMPNAASLMPGCFYNNQAPNNASAINCIFNKAKTNEADLAVYGTTTMPVNIWIIGQSDPKYKKDGSLDNISNPIIDFNNSADKQGGIYNADNSAEGWRNLKIFGYNNIGSPGVPANTFLSDGTTPDGSNKCELQSVLLGKSGKQRPKKSIDNQGIIDGAFMWFPNATFQISDLNAKTSPYLVLWTCQLIGPKTTNSSIFTPLSRQGVNSGISGLFNIQGGSSGISVYRAYGSKGTTTEDN